MSICGVFLVTDSITRNQFRCPIAYLMRESTCRGSVTGAYMWLNDSQDVDAAVGCQGEIGRRHMHRYRVKYRLPSVVSVRIHRVGSRIIIESTSKVRMAVHRIANERRVLIIPENPRRDGGGVASHPRPARARARAAGASCERHTVCTVLGNSGQKRFPFYWPNKGRDSKWMRNGGYAPDEKGASRKCPYHNARPSAKNLIAGR